MSGEPAGSVTRDGRFRLGLTGPDSHVLVREAGRGDLVIGPAGVDPKADLRVALDDVIHWPAFDPFATPAGSPWPRHLYYHGNDSGFLRWSICAASSGMGAGAAQRQVRGQRQRGQAEQDLAVLHGMSPLGC